MPTTSWLEGIKCPGCGWDQAFTVRGSATFLLQAEGPSSFKKVDWLDDDFMECTNCYRQGDVTDFMEN